MSSKSTSKKVVDSEIVISQQVSGNRINVTIKEGEKVLFHESTVLGMERHQKLQEFIDWLASGNGYKA